MASIRSPRATLPGPAARSNSGDGGNLVGFGVGGHLPPGSDDSRRPSGRVDDVQRPIDRRSASRRAALGALPSNGDPPQHGWVRGEPGSIRRRFSTVPPPSRKKALLADRRVEQAEDAAEGIVRGCRRARVRIVWSQVDLGMGVAGDSAPRYPPPQNRRRVATKMISVESMDSPLFGARIGRGRRNGRMDRGRACGRRSGDRLGDGSHGGDVPEGGCRRILAIDGTKGARSQTARRHNTVEPLISRAPSHPRLVRKPCFPMSVDSDPR